jgi:hypothetical protein
MLDVVLLESQVREYARSYMSAKIRWAIQKISASRAGTKYARHPGRANNL